VHVSARRPGSVDGILDPTRPFALAQSLANDRLRFLSVCLSCWNSPRIVTSSSSGFMEFSGLFKLFTNLPFSSLVVSTRGAKRNLQNARGLFNGHILIKHEMQDFSLTLGQRIKHSLKAPLKFRLFDRLIRLNVGSGSVLKMFDPKKSNSIHHSFPEFFCRSLPDHSEEPGLERRPSVESSLSFENLQIDTLEYVLGHPSIS
jgi:hypothetical protein